MARGSRLQRLVVTPNGIRALSEARVGSGHTVIVSSGDGEFVAGCDRCDWLSFGSYANPRARQIRDAYALHVKETHPDAEPTYCITRFFADGDSTVVERGLTLAEAQAHCRREDTHGDGWFEGYDIDTSTTNKETKGQ